MFQGKPPEVTPVPFPTPEPATQSAAPAPLQPAAPVPLPGAWHPPFVHDWPDGQTTIAIARQLQTPEMHSGLESAISVPSLTTGQTEVLLQSLALQHV